jgi:stringent starvation protein B
MEKNKFRPAEFAASVKNSANVKASIGELENARNLIKANSAFTESELEMYMPYQETQFAYAKENMDISLFNKDQKANAQSAHSYWDLINDITYISSNVTGSGVKNQDKLQMYAGRLLSKRPDCANIVKDPFN